MRKTTYDAFQLFMKGSEVLTRMESNGIRIHRKRLKRTVEDLGKRIRELEEKLHETDVAKKWRQVYGSKMKWDARQQLASVLFDHLKYETPSQVTATGKVKADRSSLESVDIPFVKEYLLFQELKKVKTTVASIGKEATDGFLHPSFNLAGGSGEDQETGGARSFRSSSSNPNFQNLFARIPEYARLVRRCFVPRKGRVLVENDFGALEFRIAACVWNDPEMISYASDPKKDIHRDTAADCYALPIKEVGKHVRYCGKNMMVFPVIYGSYYKQCSKNLWEAIEHFDLKTESGVSLKEHLRDKGIEELGACDPKQDPSPGTFEYHIKEVEERFFRRFSVFAAKKKEWIATYREKARFRMVTGFPVQGLYSNNALLNYPIQGPGFHCLLWTIIRVQEILDEEGMETLLIGQIHDCSIGDVPEGEVQKYISIVKKVVSEELPKAFDWIVVPLEIEAEVTPVGKTWWDKEQWIEDKGIWKPKPK